MSNELSALSIIQRSHAVIFCLLVFGCSQKHVPQIEQVEMVDKHVQFIVADQDLASGWTSRKWFRNRRDYMVEWPVEGEKIERRDPTRIIQLTTDLFSMDQKVGFHVDYFYGSHRDRIVRQLRWADNKKVKTQIDVLSPSTDPKKWKSAKRWVFYSDVTRPPAAISLHGKYVVVAEPFEIFDVDTFTSNLKDESVQDMFNQVRSAGKAIGHVIFDDELKILRMATGVLSTGDIDEVNLGPYQYVLRGGKLQQLSEDIVKSSSNDTDKIVLGQLMDVERREYNGHFGKASSHPFEGDSVWNVPLAKVDEEPYEYFDKPSDMAEMTFSKASPEKIRSFSIRKYFK